MPETKKFHFPSARNIDKTFWIIFFALIFIASISLASATSTLVYHSGSAAGPLMTQMVWFALGIVFAFIIQYVPSKAIRVAGYALLIGSVGCLYLMLIPHNPFVVTINGAGRWFNFFGFRFQPSEVAKLSLIIVVADMLSRPKDAQEKRKFFFITLGISAVTILPILLGNLSTAILLGGIVFLMWFLARVDWYYLVGIAGAAIIGLLLGYVILEFAFVRPGHKLPGILNRGTTWVSRIDEMVADMKAPKGDTFKLTDENYQRSIAKVAIARGGTSPFGVLPGNSQERDYLPLAFADYIFAIIVEETGVVGAGLLMFFYLAILFRACWTSSRYEDYAAIYMVMGLALMLTGQALVSMMVAVGIGPVTGQPLPLFSRGGSSVIITSLYFGVMMAVSREQTARRNIEQNSMAESWNEVPQVETPEDEAPRVDLPDEIIVEEPADNQA